MGPGHSQWCPHGASLESRTGAPEKGWTQGAEARKLGSRQMPQARPGPGQASGSWVAGAWVVSAHVSRYSTRRDAGPGPGRAH